MAAAAAPDAKVLTVVIPALNEEEAIGATLQRCLDAEAEILHRTGLRGVEFVLVSDGSTDRTEEIGYSFPPVTVLTFQANRGYGAAIKCGFEHARGDLLAFLDADGTCDPRFLGDLVTALQERDADVVLGSRMGAGSQMPWVRTLGNRVFAWLLSAFSKQSVIDTASGMRVIRRSALPDLYPLPDGLHFTPAMSARALLEGKLKLVEIPMPYAERTGRSKLSVIRDGLRFLSIIVRAAVTFKPARPLLVIAALCALLSIGCVIQPVISYVTHFRLEEWMIYRILLGSLFATIAGLIVCAAAIADRIAAVAHGRWMATREVTVLHKLFRAGPRTFFQLLFFGGAVAVVLPGIVEYVETTHVYMHWSRAVLGSLLVVAGVMISITGFLLRMMDYIEIAKDNRSDVEPPERIRPSVYPNA